MGKATSTSELKETLPQASSASDQSPEPSKTLKTSPSTACTGCRAPASQQQCVDNDTTLKTTH